MITSVATVHLEETSCCVCGTPFAIPAVMLSDKRKTAGSIYCPSGHCIGWTETEADRLRKKLATETNLRTQAELNAARALDRQQEAEAMLRKHEKRSANGVCPCCNRSFINMQRHMKTKHPEFKLIASAKK